MKPLCAVLFCLMAAAQPASAPPPALQPLIGQYALLSQTSDDIGAAIDRATATMNFVTRPAARRLLRKRNTAFASFAISWSGGRVRVERTGTPPASGVLNGTPAPWGNQDGEEMQVSYRLIAGAEPRMEETFRSKDGGKTNSFVWRPKDAVLEVNVRVVSDRLPQPVEYCLRYGRK